VGFVFRSSGGGGCGVFLLSVYSSAYLIGVELCFFLSASLESIDLSLFCSYLSVCVCFCGFWLRYTYSFLGVVSRFPQSGGR